jgi:hypothetical protein
MPILTTNQETIDADNAGPAGADLSAYQFCKSDEDKQTDRRSADF